MVVCCRNSEKDGYLFMVVGKYSLASHNNLRCQKSGVVLNKETPGQIGMHVRRMQLYPPDAIFVRRSAPLAAYRAFGRKCECCMTGDGRLFACCDYSGEFAVGPVRSSEYMTVSLKNSSNTKKKRNEHCEFLPTRR